MIKLFILGTYYVKEHIVYIVRKTGVQNQAKVTA